MNIRKKRIMHIVTLALVILLCSCGNQKSDYNEQNNSSNKIEENTQEEITKDTSYLKDYYKLINKYEKKYGKVKLLKDSTYLLYGLCCAKLADFDGDGTEELVLAYGKKVNMDEYYNVDYRYEVWTYDKEKLIKVGKGIPCGFDGNSNELRISSFNGKKYIISGGGDQSMVYEFYGMADKKLKKEISFFSGQKYDKNGEYIGELLKINDKKVSEEKYIPEFYSRVLHMESIALHDVYEDKRGIKKCKRTVRETKEECLHYQVNKQGYKTEKKEFEVESYINHWKQFASELNMSLTDNKNIIEKSKSYIWNGAYLEYKGKYAYLKNELENGISLYGIQVGDDIEKVENIMNKKGWKIFYSHENVHNYTKIDDSIDYFVSIETDHNGKILWWEIYTSLLPGETNTGFTQWWEITEYFKKLRIDAMSDWQRLYYDYLEKIPDNHSYVDTEVAFVYVDNDDIPEMVLNYASIADGGEFCYISNGSLKSQIIGAYSFMYSEKKNVFCLSGGRMDNFYDRVYSYQNGKVKLIGNGNYGALDNSHVKTDEFGSPIYVYYWNDKKVSEKKYQSEYKKVYGQFDSNSPYGDGLSLWEAQNKLIYM